MSGGGAFEEVTYELGWPGSNPKNIGNVKHYFDLILKLCFSLYFLRFSVLFLVPGAFQFPPGVPGVLGRLEPRISFFPIRQGVEGARSGFLMSIPSPGPSPGERPSNFTILLFQVDAYPRRVFPIQAAGYPRVRRRVFPSQTAAIRTFESAPFGIPDRSFAFLPSRRSSSPTATLSHRSLGCYELGPRIGNGHIPLFRKGPDCAAGRLRDHQSALRQDCPAIPSRPRHAWRSLSSAMSGSNPNCRYRPIAATRTVEVVR